MHECEKARFMSLYRGLWSFWQMKKIFLEYLFVLKHLLLSPR